VKVPSFPENRLLLTAGKRDYSAKSILESVVPAPAPEWWTGPASVKPLESIEAFPSRADAYFKDCEQRETRATLTGFCVAIGLPGPTSLLRLGQRVPELRATISRCCTRIAAGYEAMIGSGQSAGPIFMLKNIPDYDPEDPEGAPAVLFFEDRKEIVFQDVTGAAGQEDFQGDALAAYLSIIKRSRPRELVRSASDSPSRPQRMLRILSPEEVSAIEADSND
jgi:hypothetical protein